MMRVVNDTIVDDTIVIHGLKNVLLATAWRSLAWPTLPTWYREPSLMLTSRHCPGSRNLSYKSISRSSLSVVSNE